SRVRGPLLDGLPASDRQRLQRPVQREPGGEHRNVRALRPELWQRPLRALRLTPRLCEDPAPRAHSPCAPPRSRSSEGSGLEEEEGLRAQRPGLPKLPCAPVCIPFRTCPSASSRKSRAPGPQVWPRWPTPRSLNDRFPCRLGQRSDPNLGCSGRLDTCGFSQIGPRNLPALCLLLLPSLAMVTGCVSVWEGPRFHQRLCSLP
ncbi:hypothetical protein H1C71_013225, partial [Ictidomys tridecemlineatus]